ncbi:MAG: hypothetical protein ACLQI7_26520 [Streptosporangiaceae bacterium]
MTASPAMDCPAGPMDALGSEVGRQREERHADQPDGLRLALLPAAAQPPDDDGSENKLRLGWYRFQYCPVGRHWTFVAPVRNDDLTDQERRAGAQYHDTRVP